MLFPVNSLYTRRRPSYSIRKSITDASARSNGRPLQILDQVEALVAAGYVITKRPNPKRRKKMKRSATLRNGGAGGAVVG